MLPSRVLPDDTVALVINGGAPQSAVIKKNITKSKYTFYEVF